MRLSLIVTLLFAGSGIAALIYEAVWARYLKLFLGHAAYGQAATLVIYLGGIGLGSWLAGKYTDRLKSPWLAYSLVEALLGIGGMTFHQVYLWATETYLANFGQGTLGLTPFYLGKLLICVLLTLPMALALGATFPFVTAGLMRMLERGREGALSWLYFANALGGALGIFISSFYLLGAWGTEGSLKLAGILNLLLALAFIFLARKSRLAGIEAPQAKGPSLWKPSRLAFILLGATFASAFASFLYEIGWIRLLGLLLGSSTHTFDLTVGSFILGLAFGGLLSRPLIRDPGRCLRALIFVQILMGICALLTIYIHVPYVHLINESHHLFIPSDHGYLGFSAMRIFMALALVLPASFCAGMTLPMVTRLLLEKSKSEAPLGYAYACNTLGSILGAAAASLLFMPWIGLKGTILLGASLDILIGLALLFLLIKPSGLWPRLVTLACLFAIAVTGFFYRMDVNLLNAGVFRTYRNMEKVRAKEVIAVDGRTATISFKKDEDSLSIVTNGKTDAAIRTPELKPGQKRTNDEHTMASLAFIPMLTRDQPYDACIIGMGSGMTAHHLLADPLLQSLDIIEIEPAMIELSKLFRPYNERLWTDPRVNFLIGDARTRLHHSDKRYDLIISEPSNPWVSGAAGLFTTEFYASIRPFLKQDGILVQWLHIYEFNDELMLGILEALVGNFKEVEIYQCLIEVDLVLLASEDEIVLRGIERVPALESVQEDWKWGNWELSDFDYHRYVCSERTIAAMAGAHAINSDYHPVVDLFAEKARFKHSSVKFQNFLRWGPPFYQDYLEPDKQEANLAARQTLREEILPGSDEARALLLDGRPDMNWRIRKTMIHPLLAMEFTKEAWESSENVRLYREQIEQFDPPPNIRHHFALVEALALGDMKRLDDAISKVLSEYSIDDYTAHEARIVMLRMLESGYVQDATSFYQKVVLKLDNRMSFEETYLLGYLLQTHIDAAKVLGQQQAAQSEAPAEAP